MTIEKNQWRDCFFKKAIKIIEPCNDRLSSVVQNNNKNQLYSLQISHFDGKFEKLKVQNSFLIIHYLLENKFQLSF
jgi:hypothetical protein